MMRELESGGSGPVIAPTFVNPAASAIPTIPTLPTAGGYGGYGNNGILEMAVLLGLVGNRGFGFGNNGNGNEDQVSAQNTSNLRKDVAEIGTEVHKLGNEIQSAFAIQTADNSSNFRNLDNQICETDKNAIRAQYEGKIQTLESTNTILDKIDDRAIGIKDQLYGMSTTMASEFCDLKHLMEHNTNKLSLQAERNSNETNQLIKDKFCELETKALENEIAKLREQLECQRRDRDAITNSLMLSQQTNSIVNAIDSQLNRQTSSLVQIGTGNLGASTPSSTNTTVN